MSDLKSLQKKLPKTIELKKDHVVMIDQLLLPSQLKFIKLKTYQQVIKAIYTMQIRGAQAIGAAGASAVVLAANSYKSNNVSNFLKFLNQAAIQIAKTRPTAVNLAWAVKKVMSETKGNSVAEIKKNIFIAADKLLNSEMQNNLEIGKYGQVLIKNGARILTHCNAGSLSGVWFGTATAPIFAAHLAGKKIKVLMDETRPMLQGARLTAWEMIRAGIDCQLNIDSASGYLMSHGLVDIVIVGADRIVKNGDVANKIGTYPLALMAREHNIPFYVAAMNSTIDLNLASGKDIPIEQRNSDEIIKDILYYKKPVAPKGVKAFNPVFDVTPAKLVTGIITEKGIFEAPQIADSLK
ncbi:MAG: S-methyl-5-thioribose-1-phosphate isomerase [Candidatus Buchananbacteria bacterium]